MNFEEKDELEIKKNNHDYENTTEEVCAMPNQCNLFVVAPEKAAEFLAQRANPENTKERKRVLSKVNIRNDIK